MKQPPLKSTVSDLILKRKVNVAVLGGGSWATAIVKLLTNNKRKVGWYVRSSVNAEFIVKHHHNPNYLPSTKLKTKRLKISTDINEIVSNADLIIVAIPSAFITSAFEKLDQPLDKKIIFSAVKGVIPETMLIVGEHFKTKYNVSLEKFGVISGPSHAEEIAMERLSYLTIACTDQKLAKVMAALLRTDHVRTKLSNDIIGTEYASMLKNIYAIAAGMAHGLGYGDNFQSVLISNAIREMKRFINNVYEMKRNINNSAYLGDLLVTSYSVFSRNRSFGNMIGKGYTVKSAQLEMRMVAEGYYATQSAKKMSQSFNSDLPIIDCVYAILYEGKNPEKMFKRMSKKLN